MHLLHPLLQWRTFFPDLDATTDRPFITGWVPAVLFLAAFGLAGFLTNAPGEQVPRGLGAMLRGVMVTLFVLGAVLLIALGGF